MIIKQLIAAIVAAGFASAAMANGTDIASTTQSTAQQQVGVANEVNIGGTPARQDIHYSGSYDTRSAPTVYSPGLTSSVTETCLGSVSGSVSVVGLGVAAGTTMREQGCHLRLTASVMYRMDRKDIAFNLMCQDPSVREAAALTDKPCLAAYEFRAVPAASSADVRQSEPQDPVIRARLGLPLLPGATQSLPIQQQH